MFTSSFEKTASKMKGPYGSLWKKRNKHAMLEKKFSGSKRPETMIKETDHMLKKMDAEEKILINKTFNKILKGK